LELTFLIDRDLLDYLAEDLVPRLEKVLLVNAQIPLPEMLLRHTLPLIGIKRSVIVRWTILDPVPSLPASVADVVRGWFTRLRPHSTSLSTSATPVAPGRAATLRSL